MQNLGLAVVSLLSGIIVDNGGFFMLEIFFIGWLSGNIIFSLLFIDHFNFTHSIIVALIATVIIYLYDKNTQGNLNMTPDERAELVGKRLVYIFIIH